MPLESPKPPDPLVKEFCALIKMSYVGIRGVSESEFRAVLSKSNGTGTEGKLRKHHHGIKIRVSTPGSSSTGAGIDRAKDVSVVSPNDMVNGNDGSFIILPLDDNPIVNDQCGSVAKSSSPKASFDCTGMGDVGNASCDHASPFDGITSAKTGMDCGLEKEGSNIRSEHISIEDVVSTDVASFGVLNGIASDMGFEFGRNESVIVSNGAKTSWVSREDGFINVESFTEKMRKGVEDRETQLNYVGSEACVLQLYGYFVGTSMDYRVVNSNLSRMWRVYGIESITKTSSGIFDFKFKSEEGMKTILESESWMINNIPLVLNLWEPGIWLEKVEPSTIPIWVCVHNIPMELCNGNGISKIMSGSGKPMLMDKMTKERCLKKAKKLDFARVLVEVSAKEEFPHVLEIAYPPIGNRPVRVGRLNVKYQWMPPLCTHCNTLDHSTSACKIRPRTKDELAANVANKAMKESKICNEKINVVEEDNEGFVTVGRRNRPMNVQSNTNNENQQSRSGNNFQNKGVQNSYRQSYGNAWQNKGRGSGSQSVQAGNIEEDVHISNSFQVLDDQVLKEKEDVVIAVMDEEYHNYGIDPISEEDDVANEDGGMADEMRPEYEFDPCQKQGIIVGWDPYSIKVMVLNRTSQLMNLFVETVNGHQSFYCSFIYAHTKVVGRRYLWKDLIFHSQVVKDNPWVLLGDFNSIIDPSERSAGSSSVTQGMVDFRDCLAKIEVADLVMSGLNFTWNKSRGRTDGLLKKFDRVLSNIGFVEKFPNANAQFIPFVVSDHSSCVLNIPGNFRSKLKPFKFANYLAKKPEFLPIPLRMLRNAQGNLAEKVKFWKSKLERVQTAIVNDSHNANLRLEEISVKMKLNRNRIEHIKDMDGFAYSGGEVDEAAFMVRPISKEEVKETIFGMEDDKEPGPDGFSAKFVKSSWSIIGNELCATIQDFFGNGKLLKEVNATIIALVPKTQSPSNVSEFRPIACCNILYKCITKVISNRIKGVIGNLVSESQSAFIPSRQISDNILISQELLRNYHRDIGPAKVAFKIDL
ncbi:hypothetical protein Tco_0585671 [Tanacetum coccineum]